MTASTDDRITSIELVAALRETDAYPVDADPPVILHETHISWVFLAGDFAYKVKKPITTSFLDYGTLEKRRHCCDEEMRLDSRYASDLYLGVVPITIEDGRVRVEGVGEPIEFAVKMKRFPDGALLSERLERGTLTTEEVQELANSVANFHSHAARLEPGRSTGSEESHGSEACVLLDAIDNLRALQAKVPDDTGALLHVIELWTHQYFDDRAAEFRQRIANGFVRECHGDLHLANIVHWQDRLVPFDGIEFNEEFRWIDVLSDAAFLAMDFAARGHLDLCRSFINAYLELTGDHASLSLLRWYLVYRAMVRAKVALIRAEQQGLSDVERSAAYDDCRDHVDLAYRFTLPEEPRLWITHGVSGSGKTRISEFVVQRRGAFRLRSDIERKRHFGMLPMERPDEKMLAKLYSESANHATYGRLRQLACGILRAGYSVVIDATFLKRGERDHFHEFALDEGVGFAILDCHADEATLRQRIADRMARDDDASDADIHVLEAQLASQEPLTERERQYVVDIPDVMAAIGSL